MGKCSPARSRRPISIIFGALERIFDASFGFGIFVLLNTIRIFGKRWILPTPHYSINGRLYAIWFNLWNSDSTFGYPVLPFLGVLDFLCVSSPEEENLSGLLQFFCNDLLWVERIWGEGQRGGRESRDIPETQDKSRRGRAGVSNSQKPRRRLGKTSLADVRPDSTGGDKVKTAFQILICYYESG